MPAMRAYFYHRQVPHMAAFGLVAALVEFVPSFFNWSACFVLWWACPGIPPTHYPRGKDGCLLVPPLTHLHFDRYYFWSCWGSTHPPHPNCLGWVSQFSCWKPDHKEVVLVYMVTSSRKNLTTVNKLWLMIKVKTFSAHHCKQTLIDDWVKTLPAHDLANKLQLKIKVKHSKHIMPNKLWLTIKVKTKNCQHMAYKLRLMIKVKHFQHITAKKLRLMIKVKICSAYHSK